MFGKFFAACAVILIGGGMVMGQQFNGVFTGQSQGQNVAVSLQSDGETVHGVVTCNGMQMPLAGRSNNGRLEGIWHARNGQDIPFVAVSGNSGLELQTAGITYSLSREQAAAIREDRPQIQQQVQPAAANVEVQMVQGQFYSRPVPAGWTSTESSNETFISTPDGSFAIGFSGIERVNAGTPAQFLQFMAVNIYKATSFQMISAQPIPFESGEAIEAIFTAGSKGRMFKYWARVAVVHAYGATSGYMLFAGADPDKFEQALGTLKMLAEKIQVINATGAFGRDAALAVQRNRNFNHPMDHSFADGYWKNQKTLEGVYARGSDVRRDSYTSTDPTTGQQYYHTQAAWDPTRGGVVNPECPNELLTPAQHWQGH